MNQPYFTIKQAAEIAGMTAEALRHYDRTGLVKPVYTDGQTGYRYYSETELVRLKTIALLKQMDLPLSEIKEILRQDDLSKLVALLRQAEIKAEEKIARLQQAKEHIRRAYTDYESKLRGANAPEDSVYTRVLPARAILLSDHLEHPTLKNLWNYLGHFYQQIGPARRDEFLFEDTAGMLTVNGRTRLFAVCLRYPAGEPVAVLPAGAYLCMGCTEENREQALKHLQSKAPQGYGKETGFVVHKIIVTGILQWKYEIQIFAGEADKEQQVDSGSCTNSMFVCS